MSRSKKDLADPNKISDKSFEDIRKQAKTRVRKGYGTKIKGKPRSRGK